MVNVITRMVSMDIVPGDLNRCPQRRMGQCYFQQSKRYLLWASAKRT